MAANKPAREGCQEKPGRLGKGARFFQLCRLTLTIETIAASVSRNTF